MLASLVFACGGLDFSATQHFETFAGRMEVTKAEMEAPVTSGGIHQGYRNSPWDFILTRFGGSSNGLGMSQNRGAPKRSIFN